MKWDIFICHASEDKKEVAEPLAKKLTASNLKVWYDKSTLTVGDNLRRKIEEGLARSRFGVVILSPSFFKKNWPQKELDGLAARQDSEGHKIILPVWHHVDQAYVAKYSPMLADLFASKTADGLETVLEELLTALAASGIDIAVGAKQQQVAEPFVEKSKEQELVCANLLRLINKLIREGGLSIRQPDGLSVLTVKETEVKEVETFIAENIALIPTKQIIDDWGLASQPVEKMYGGPYVQYVLPYQSLRSLADLLVGKKAEPQKPPFNMNDYWAKSQYQNKVKRDVTVIEKELGETDKPNDIQFLSWNAGIDHGRKPWLIDNENNFNALQDLSDALNGRNNYLREAGSNNLEFPRLNKKCIEAVEKLKQLHFIG
jgi:hypothetical protein